MAGPAAGWAQMTAIAAGYRPCGTCCKDRYQAWKTTWVPQVGCRSYENCLSRGRISVAMSSSWSRYPPPWSAGPSMNSVQPAFQ